MISTKQPKKNVHAHIRLKKKHKAHPCIIHFLIRVCSCASPPSFQRVQRSRVDRREARVVGDEDVL